MAGRPPSAFRILGRSSSQALQARGEHNPRDFDKYIFQLPIPLFDPNNHDHNALVDLAGEADQVVAVADLPPASFQAQRCRLRAVLDEAGLGKTINAAVALLRP